MKDASEDEEIAAYMAAQNVVLEKWAKKDGEGEPQKAENGAWDVAEEDHPSVKAELVPIKAKYAEAVKRQEKRNADLKAENDAYMEGKVDVRLYTVPWENIPERIGGGYLVRISPMITDAPPIEPDEPEEEEKCGPFDPDMMQMWTRPEDSTPDELNQFISKHVPAQHVDCVATTRDPGTKKLVVRYTPEEE